MTTGTESVLGRCVSAEIRSMIAVDRQLTAQKLAAGIGRSQNYMSIRLRDEKSFTLDDVEAVVRYLDMDYPEFFERVWSHMDYVYGELTRLDRRDSDDVAVVTQTVALDPDESPAESDAQPDGAAP